MSRPDFVIVGSSGGGGTIAWVLAKAGLNVVILEQGSDFAAQVTNHRPNAEKFNESVHDEYRLHGERPTPWERMRGEYNTFRETASEVALPLPGMGGQTAAMLGGGSVMWGAWAYRATPIDFKLRTHFKEIGRGQLAAMDDWGYSISDWPIEYGEMEPFYNVAETLLAVSGSREQINHGIKESTWYQAFKDMPHFQDAGIWFPSFPFPCPPIPTTPVGAFIEESMETVNYHPFSLPCGMVSPSNAGSGFNTRAEIENALKFWGDGPRPEFWQQSADEIWSGRVRDACNLCGYCGGYLCWGKDGPKSGNRFTTLKELEDLPNVEIRTESKAIEILYDDRTHRATGVRYLDLSDPDEPKAREISGDNVVVSCGAVQSARLLHMSGPPTGLGNRYDQLGRNVTFHMFDLVTTSYLNEDFQGLMHAEFANTGNIASFENYFVEDTSDGKGHHKGWWCKAGTMVSTAKKNPLSNAIRQYSTGKHRLDDGMWDGKNFLENVSEHARKVQLRLTGDDMPMPENRVDLDPRYVDEYGLPVARITRRYGENEKWVGRVMEDRFMDAFKHFHATGVLKRDTKYRPGDVRLIGHHQHGTCRMGDDPQESVVDRNCRLHDVKNLFVVDTSCFPTGFGLNPMVTVVANALRVGTWIVNEG